MITRRAGRAALGREALGEKHEIEAGPACAGGDQTIRAEKVGRVSDLLLLVDRALPFDQRNTVAGDTATMFAMSLPCRPPSSRRSRMRLSAVVICFPPGLEHRRVQISWNGRCLILHIDCKNSKI